MNSIDIPVHGFESNYMNIFDVVQAAHRHREKHDYEAAAKLYRDAADVCNQEAQYHLALLLKEREVFSWSREKRFRESERLLLNLRSRNCPFQNIDFDLANLYFRAGKYCSALAHLLIRKAEGHDVPPDLLSYYQERMLKNAEIDLSEDAHGAFLIGKTLLVLGGSTEKVIYFIEQAVSFGGNQAWVGFAALELADVYRGRDEILCRKFLKLAEKHGTPEILMPRKSSLK